MTPLPPIPDQGALRRAILDPEAPVPPGLRDPKGRPAGKRFDVYRNNVVASLADALAEAFPVVRKLVGASNFRVIAIAYARAHPPASPILSRIGAEMPAFLAAFAPVRKLGYLPDVARLELALRESYHAADRAPMDARLLTALAPDILSETRFSLAPALRLVPSDWPIVAIWRFNAEDGPKPGMRPEIALVTRPDFDPVLAALDPAGGAFVGALAQGAELGRAAEAATALDPDFDPAPVLGTLIAGGALTAHFTEPAP